MAILPNAVHSNPNLTAVGVGAGAGGVTYLLADVEPLTAIGVSIGAAVVARGVLWADSDRKTLDVPAGRLGVTPKGNGAQDVDFQGTLNDAEFKELQEFLARTKKAS